VDDQSKDEMKADYQPLSTEQPQATTADGIQSAESTHRRVGSARNSDMSNYRLTYQNQDDDAHNQIRRENMQQSVQQMMEKKRTYLHLTAT
jgi:hypothetical protein